MSRRKKFKGLKEEGAKAHPIWFAFSFIGYAIVFFTCSIGGTLLMNSVFFGLAIAVFFFLCFFFISQYLENDKTSKEGGDNRVFLWIAYAFVSIMSAIVGHHYLHTFHSESATSINYEEAVIKEKVNLIRGYSVLATQMSDLENCDTRTLTEDADTLQKELTYYINKSTTLRNPFLFLFNFGNNAQERSFDDIKEDVIASINNYKLLNKGSCKDIPLQFDSDLVLPVKGENTLSSSLTNANWLLLLGLLLIPSFLILAPYFMGDPARTILKLRKR